MNRIDEEKAAAFHAMIDETKSLFHRVRAVADELHRDPETTAGMRGILESLERHGPQTVPQMACARPVTRQHVQTLINQLLDRRLVELVPNPAHRKSHLVQLTLAGSELVESLLDRENRLVSAIDFGISERKMYDAAEALRAVRRTLEAGGWKRLPEP